MEKAKTLKRIGDNLFLIKKNTKHENENFNQRNCY